MSSQANGLAKMQRNRPRGKLYEANGEWKTLAEWSKHCGVAAGTLHNRVVVMGLTMSQAMAHERHQVTKVRAGAKLVEVDGVSKTLDSWSLEVGIDPTTLRRRMRRGMSAKEAITTPADAERQASAMCKGNLLAEVAAVLGVTKQAIQQTERRARTHIRTGFVVKRVDKWMSKTGNYLSDDAIADIVAHVLGSDSVWEALDSGDLDVADLCRAAKRMESENG